MTEKKEEANGINGSAGPNDSTNFAGAVTPELPETGQPPINGAGDQLPNSPAESSLEAAERPADQADCVLFLRAFLDRHGIEILADGQMQIAGQPAMASCPSEVEIWLRGQLSIDFDWVIDTILLEQEDCEFKPAQLQRALRHISREDKRNRDVIIKRDLFGPKLSRKERRKVRNLWSNLTKKLFDGKPALNEAVLRHFIWQVKRKISGRQVDNHLMPIISSSTQGSGKTTFVWKFLAPLTKELVGPVTLSAVADSRSGDIYSFPVLFIDDVDPLHPNVVPHLKSLLTSTSFRRRLLFTSKSASLRQGATFIGTANQPIHALVIDETGHRRFFDLQFKNGNPAKGGDPKIWETVDQTDYSLLWRSVDAFRRAPITPHLEALAVSQEHARPVDVIRQWLGSFDPNSDEVKQITNCRGIGARELYEYFGVCTGSELSEKKFKHALRARLGDPSMPFTERVRTAKGWVYPLKKTKSSVLELASSGVESLPSV